MSIHTELTDNGSLAAEPQLAVSDSHGPAQRCSSAAVLQVLCRVSVNLRLLPHAVYGVTRHGESRELQQSVERCTSNAQGRPVQALGPQVPWVKRPIQTSAG